MKTKYRFCKDCKWEFDFKGCKNGHKTYMLKHKDGSLKCMYCAWKTPKEKIDVSETIRYIDEEIKFLNEIKRRIKSIGKGNYFTREELEKSWIKYKKDPTKLAEKLRKEEWSKALKKAKGNKKKAMKLYGNYEKIRR